MTARGVVLINRLTFGLQVGKWVIKLHGNS